MRMVWLACLALSSCSSAHSKSDGGVVSDMAMSSFVLDDNPAKLADITLTSYAFTGLAMTDIGADFSTFSGGAGGPCSHKSVGGCLLRSCPRDDGGGVVMALPRTRVDAGTLTLTGLGNTPQSLPPDANHNYGITAMRSWNGGEMLTMQASGGVVPAFSASVVAPARSNATSPAMQATVDRKQGYTFGWTPVPSATLQLLITTDLPDAFLYLTCETDAASGSYTVTPAALSSLPVDGVDTSTGAEVYTRTTTSAGDWPVTVSAAAPIDDSAGDASWHISITWQ